MQKQADRDPCKYSSSDEVDESLLDISLWTIATSPADIRVPRTLV